MKIKLYLSLGIILLAIGSRLQAQNKATAEYSNDHLVQLSGFIVTADSVNVIPYVTVRIAGTNRGVFSDMSGFFSLVCKKEDIILFTALGQKQTVFRLPDNLTDNKLITVVKMQEDTFYLPEVVVRPYSTPQELDYYFAKTKIPGSSLSQAYSNLNRVPYSVLEKGILPDGTENGRWYQQAQAERLYYNGQPQYIPIADIGSWYRFFNAINNKKKK